MKTWRNMLSTSLLITSSYPYRDDDVQCVIRTHTAHTTFSGNHPDVFIIQPIEGKMSISIEQVHELAALSWHAPVLHTQRVIVITPAEALTLPAQQALLKTLEEPPVSTQFLLLTHRPYKLLPTIHSRCQLVVFTDQKREETKDLFTFPKTYSECIRLSDEWTKNKETIKRNVENLLLTPNLSQAKQKTILLALARLNQNVNAKLVLDELFFSFRVEKQI